MLNIFRLARDTLSRQPGATSKMPPLPINGSISEDVGILDHKHAPVDCGDSGDPIEMIPKKATSTSSQLLETSTNRLVNSTAKLSQIQSTTEAPAVCREHPLHQHLMNSEGKSWLKDVVKVLYDREQSHEEQVTQLVITIKQLKEEREITDEKVRKLQESLLSQDEPSDWTSDEDNVISSSFLNLDNQIRSWAKANALGSIESYFNLEQLHQRRLVAHFKNFMAFNHDGSTDPALVAGSMRTKIQVMLLQAWLCFCVYKTIIQKPFFFVDDFMHPHRARHLGPARPPHAMLKQAMRNFRLQGE